MTEILHHKTIFAFEGSVTLLQFSSLLSSNRAFTSEDVFFFFFYLLLVVSFTLIPLFYLLVKRSVCNSHLSFRFVHHWLPRPTVGQTYDTQVDAVLNKCLFT